MKFFQVLYFIFAVRMDDPEEEHIGQVGDMKLEDELGIGGQNHGKQR
jgi:hypothetical protein